MEFEILELEDKVSGNIWDFNLYHDADLPFLNQNNERCALIKKNIIHGEVDDDCQTDQEQKEDAKRMLKDELRNAIAKFVQDKKDGTIENNIKNYNIQKRYSRVPFNLPCTD